MTEIVQLGKRDNIGVITIDNPPVNVLSHSVRDGLVRCLAAAEQDAAIEAVVLACAGRTFIAGADITEFGKPLVQPDLPAMLEAMDQFPKLLVAALHGTALGGGLETALTCHYRVAAPGARVGLPEVTLGIIPGAGGTQRLPRITGLENALDLITSGRHVKAAEAQGMGLIDRIADGDLTAAAVGYAGELVAGGHGPRRISEMAVEDSGDHGELFSAWRERVAKKARGQKSPLVAIDAVENAVLHPFTEGLRRERELFNTCRDSAQSRALRHIFFAERQAARIPGIGKETATLDINETAIIGAGTMGSGVAMCFANAGIPVQLLEINAEALQKGLQTIEKNYQRMVAQKRISEQQCNDRLRLIKGTCDYADLGNADLVIEAAFESMEVKQTIFRSLDKHCKPEAILASNTSYLDINQIGDSVANPARVLGMHFFSPAHIMKLLEVVRTDATSPEALLTAMKIGKRIRKIPVQVGVCFGFVGNRMYSAYQREGQMLLLEGAGPRQIDAAIQAWGMAMGPTSVLDLSGIDIGYNARKQNPNPPDDPLYFRPADLLAEAGLLGRKTGRGFYVYDKETRGKTENAEAVELIRAEAQRLGVAQRDIGVGEIQDRMLLAMVNEGAKILSEGVANRAGDIDVVWVNGYGFPRWRGGPMQYAQETGLDAVLDKIRQFQREQGDRYWKPAKLLEERARKGNGWTD